MRRTAVLSSKPVAGAAALLLVGVASLLPRPADLQAELKQLGVIETKAISDYKASLSEANGRLLGNTHLADQIEKGLIPPWTAEQSRLAALKGLPDRQQRLVSLLLKYMEARQQGWSMFAAACRNKDVKTLVAANLKQTEAAKLVAELKNLPH